jgi:hypothetical protein
MQNKYLQKYQDFVIKKRIQITILLETRVNEKNQKHIYND